MRRQRKKSFGGLIGPSRLSSITAQAIQDSRVPRNQVRSPIRRHTAGRQNRFLVRKKLFLSKVGYVNVIFHRELPTSQEKLKTCTVTREKNGDWYASLVYENFRDSSPIPARFTKPVGVDLGLNSLVTTTDGVKIHHTRILRRFERRLKRFQADFSRTQRGSKNRVKEAQTAGSPVFEGVKATRRLQS